MSEKTLLTSDALVGHRRNAEHDINPKEQVIVWVDRAGHTISTEYYHRTPTTTKNVCISPIYPMNNPLIYTDIETVADRAASAPTHRSCRPRQPPPQTPIRSARFKHKLRPSLRHLLFTLYQLRHLQDPRADKQRHRTPPPPRLHPHLRHRLRPDRARHARRPPARPKSLRRGLRPPKLPRQPALHPRRRRGQ
jgi:hypothetical protein